MKFAQGKIDVFLFLFCIFIQIKRYNFELHSILAFTVIHRNGA